MDECFSEDTEKWDIKLKKKRMNNAEKGYESEKSFCKELLFRLECSRSSQRRKRTCLGIGTGRFRISSMMLRVRQVLTGEKTQDKYMD